MPKAYSAVSITLFLADHPYNVLAEARAIDPDISPSVKSMSVEGDYSNGAGSNDFTRRIYIGDSNVSSIRKGYSLGFSDAREIPEGAAIGQIYAAGSTAGLILNVEVFGKA